MKEFVNIEYLSRVQIIIDLFLIVLILVIIRKIYSIQKKEKIFETEKIVNIANILKEGKNLAKQFEKQIIEKREIIKNLNERLDKKIGDLKLLVVKVENIEKNGTWEKKQKNGSRELEEEVILMAKNNIDNDAIAKKLNISKNEVEMIISLKKETEN